jgi:hypothetical protein
MAASTATLSPTTDTGRNLDISWQSVWDTVSSFVTDFPGSFLELSNLMQYSMAGLILCIITCWIATRRDAAFTANTSFLLIIVALTAMMGGLAGHEIDPYVTSVAIWSWSWYAALAPLAQGSLIALVAFFAAGFTFGGGSSKAANIVGCSAIIGIICAIFVFIFSLSGHTFEAIKALF